MENIKHIITELINETLVQAVLSNAKNPDKMLRAKYRPIQLKDTLYIQETIYVGTKVLHANLKWRIISIFLSI